MKTRKCPNCGAVNTFQEKECNYCSSPLEINSKITPEIQNELKSFIFGMEKILKKAKNKNDGKVMTSFGIIFFLWIGISYYIYTQKVSLLVSVGSFISIGIFAFLFFGFWVMKFEVDAMEKYFNDKLSGEIQNYLNQKGINKIDFKLVVMEILDEKSDLYNFITDLT